MQFSVDLQPAASFPVGWTLLGIALLAAPAAMWLLYLLRRKKAPKMEPEQPPAAGLYGKAERARGKYLNLLLQTERKHARGKLSLRDAFLELSAIARGFVYEFTGTDARTMSLSELERMNLGSLADLVAEYYEPEFALRSEADFAQSCARTRQMIRTWR